MYQILLTLANIQKVSEIEEVVSFFKNQTLNLPKLIIFYKTLKVVRYVINIKVILNHTNTELFEANMQ